MYTVQGAGIGVANGKGYRARTCDWMIKSHTLYQLS